VLPSGNMTQRMPCAQSGQVGLVGTVAADSWFAALAQVEPRLPKLGVSSSTFVLFLVQNVLFQFDGGVLADGYHDFLGSLKAPITYAVAGVGPITGNIVHIDTLSHEFAEWLDDPAGSNPTPPWGHVGQQSGCQADLEVGDPLSFTAYRPILMPNGFFYVPQETAFFSWFYDQVPSLGFDGWYSSAGTFKAPAAPCP
jgi:hypothetical protein